MKLIWRNLPAIVSLTLLGAAIIYLGQQHDRISAITAAWNQIAPLDIVCAVSLMILAQLAIAWRCTLIYEAAGLVRRHLFFSNIRIQLITLFASHGAIIPGFGDVAKGTLVKLRFDVPVPLAMKLVIYERICTAVGFMMVGILVLPLSFAYPLPYSLILLQALIWTGGLAAFAVIVWLGRQQISINQPMIDRLIRALLSISEIYHDRRQFFLLLLSAILQIAFIAASFVLLAHGMALKIDPTLVCLFMPFIVFVFSLPVFYVGWGGREAMVIMTIGNVAHIPAPQALALSAAYGVIVFFAAFPGALLWLIRPSMRKRQALQPLPATGDQQQT